MKKFSLFVFLLAGSVLASSQRPDDYYLNPAAPEAVSRPESIIDRALAEFERRAATVSADTGCKPMSLKEYQSLIIPNPDANNVGCYEQYLYEMQQAFVLYLAETMDCFNPTSNSFDCACLQTALDKFMDRERDLLTWMWSGCQGPI